MCLPPAPSSRTVSLQTSTQTEGHQELEPSPKVYFPPLRFIVKNQKHHDNIMISSRGSSGFPFTATSPTALEGELIAPLSLPPLVKVFADLESMSPLFPCQPGGHSVSPSRLQENVSPAHTLPARHSSPALCAPTVNSHMTPVGGRVSKTHLVFPNLPPTATAFPLPDHCSCHCHVAKFQRLPPPGSLPYSLAGRISLLCIPQHPPRPFYKHASHRTLGHLGLPPLGSSRWGGGTGSCQDRGLGKRQIWPCP